MSAMFGVVEAKQRFEELLERASGGERVVVTRQGRPLAAIVPLEDGRAGQADAVEDDSESRPVGLGAVAGAMAGWSDLDGAVASALTSRAVARGRHVPELE